MSGAQRQYVSDKVVDIPRSISRKCAAGFPSWWGGVSSVVEDASMFLHETFTSSGVAEIEIKEHEPTDDEWQQAMESAIGSAESAARAATRGAESKFLQPKAIQHSVRREGDVRIGKYLLRVEVVGLFGGSELHAQWQRKPSSEG